MENLLGAFPCGEFLAASACPVRLAPGPQLTIITIQCSKSSYDAFQMLSNATPRGPRVSERTGLLGLPSPPTAPMDLQARADEAASLLKALANPDRLLLLCQLVSRECSVSELGASAGIEQPSLSQQLGVLRGERLVATRRQGKQVIYRIASPAALTVLEALFGLFCDPAQPTAAVKARSAGGSGRRRAGKKNA